MVIKTYSVNEHALRLVKALKREIDCPEASLLPSESCATYPNAVNDAVELATREGLLASNGDDRMRQILANEHGIRIPWLFFADGKDTRDNEAKKAAVVSEIEHIRHGVIREGYAPNTPAFNRELSRRLFTELTPFAQFRSGEIDPREGAWRLYAVLMMAGLRASFVALPVTPLGIPTPTHVALKIDLGEAQSVIADPAYEAFDLTGFAAVPLDAAQALAIYAIQRAESQKTPLATLELAQRLDPTNRYVPLLKMEAKVGIGLRLDPPLSQLQESDEMVLALARAEVARTRSQRSRQ
jgi:hypothetical protein